MYVVSMKHDTLIARTPEPKIVAHVKYENTSIDQ